MSNFTKRKMLERVLKYADKILGKQCEAVCSSIKSDGSAIPVHGKCYNLKVGNIHNDSLMKIRASAAFGAFRKAVHFDDEK
jgi:hypothetical protein